MAEVVVGWAFLSPVIQGICERLASTDFRDYFDKQLVKKLEITLISINKLLDDAETKQYENLDVKNWLDYLQHELYEVDHLLDVIATDAGPKGKLRRFLSGSINRFESRIKALVKRLEFLADQKDALRFKVVADNYEFGVRRKLLDEIPTVSLIDESVICGREHEKEEMIDFLFSDSDSDNQVPIISIVGLRGMGKTTLAQLVYNDHRIQKHFELKAWVHVSEFYDHRRLIKSILRSISSAAVGDEGTEILYRQLQQLLAGKKYLIVLDHVWKKDGNMLEYLLLPFNQY